MTNFRCKRCNYQFSMQLDKLPRSCPNCGEKSSVVKEQTAQDLLEESD